MRDREHFGSKLCDIEEKEVLSWARVSVVAVSVVAVSVVCRSVKTGVFGAVVPPITGGIGESTGVCVGRGRRSSSAL